MLPRKTRSTTKVADVPEGKTKEELADEKKELAAEKRAVSKVATQQRKSETIAAFEEKAKAKDAKKMAAAQVRRQMPKLKQQGAMLDVTKRPSPACDVGTAAPEVCSVLSSDTLSIYIYSHCNGIRSAQKVCCTAATRVANLRIRCQNCWSYPHPLWL